MESAPKVPHLVQPATGKTERDNREIKRSELINRLNFIHFQDSTVLLQLKHSRRQHQLIVKAIPLPYAAERLECRWADPASLPQNLEDYRLHKILIDDDRLMITFDPIRSRLSANGASFTLPEKGFETGDRRIRRHPSTGIGIRLSQNGLVFPGALLDFNPLSLRVEVTENGHSASAWLDPETPVHLLIEDGNTTLFTGSCRLLRQTGIAGGTAIVLRPVSSQLRRFRPREHRSLRQQLLPAPEVVFRHPLTGKLCRLPIVDLSGSGFAVEEEESASVLLPGLIIPEMQLCLANSCRIDCRTQVVYRLDHAAEGDAGRIRCGIAILDMPLKDQAVLLGLLQQAKDSRASLGARIDPDELWKFFFASGFIYPEKYRSMEAHREKFKETYRKLHDREPGIARVFTYQEHGRILGHIAMLRFFDRSWLIHHHAALRGAEKSAGLKVLGQISRYVNELHHLPSARLDYVFCYFRPENRFPNRVFGGVAQHIDDPEGCALYPFAYLPPHRTKANTGGLSEAWRLEESGIKDIEELKLTLADNAGPMIISAFDLEPDRLGSPEVSREYANIGFRRESRLYSLRRSGSLKAILLVNTADIGLNLSELTNSIKVFVIDPEGLPSDILESAISRLGSFFEEGESSVLIYPRTYAEQQGIDHEKTYNLWILNLRFLDSYFRYCRRFLRDI